MNASLYKPDFRLSATDVAVLIAGATGWLSVAKVGLIFQLFHGTMRRRAHFCNFIVGYIFQASYTVKATKEPQPDYGVDLSLIRI